MVVLGHVDHPVYVSASQITETKLQPEYYILKYINSIINKLHLLNPSSQIYQFRLFDDFLGHLGIAGEVVQELRVVHTVKVHFLGSLSHCLVLCPVNFVL